MKSLKDKEIETIIFHYDTNRVTTRPTPVKKMYLVKFTKTSFASMQWIYDTQLSLIKNGPKKENEYVHSKRYKEEHLDHIPENYVDRIKNKKNIDFEIKKIISKRVTKKVEEFKVLWSPFSFTTFETKEFLARSFPKTLKTYMDEFKKEKKRKREEKNEKKKRRKIVEEEEDISPDFHGIFIKDQKYEREFNKSQFLTCTFKENKQQEIEKWMDFNEFKVLIDKTFSKPKK